MKKGSIKIASFALALAVTAMTALPAAAKESTPANKFKLENRSNTVSRSQGESIGGGTNPVSVEVYPSGAMGVFISDYDPHPEQFYAGYDYGTVWHIDGRKYSTRYLEDGTGIVAGTTAAGTLGMGTLSRSGNTATVVWNKDNITFTQSITHTPGTRNIQQAWTITNNTGAPLNNVIMITGGDTYFAGDDWGYAGYEAATGTVFVMRDSTSGMMTFTPVGGPADKFFAGDYSIGRNYARAGNLPDTADGNHRDQSYYLQWNHGTMANGQTIVVEGQQDFAEAGNIMAAPPPPQMGMPGDNVPCSFLVTNATAAPVGLNFSASSSRGYPVTITDTANQPLTTATLPAMGSLGVVVHVAVPANAPVGQDEIALTSSFNIGGAASVVSTTNLNIVTNGVHVLAPANQETDPNTSVIYDFTVLNAYQDLPSVNLGYSASTSLGYSTTIVGGDFATLNYRQQATVQVKVDIPAGARRNSDVLTFKANYLDVANQAQSASATVSTLVKGSYGTPSSGGSGGSSGDGGSIVYLNPRLRDGGSGATPAVTDGTIWIEKGDVPGITKDDAYRSRNTRNVGLRATAAAAMSANKPLIHNTIGSKGDVLVQVTIPNPGKVETDLLLSGSVSGARVESTKAHFNKWFDGDFAVISMQQQGAWGQEVRIAAKVSLKDLDTKNLVFYTFDRATNSYKKIANPRYKIDANGYLCFYTERGGDIVVTDGSLMRK